MKAVFFLGALIVVTMVATTPVAGHTVTADELIQAWKYKRQAATTKKPTGTTEGTKGTTKRPPTGGPITGGPPTGGPPTGGPPTEETTEGGDYCLNYMQSCEQGGRSCCNGDCIVLLDADSGLCMPVLEG